MSSAKNHMSNRSIASINKEIYKCLENINTWAVVVQKLISIKRNLLKNKHVDAKFYLLAKAMEDAFYNEDLSNNKVYGDQTDRESNEESNEKDEESNNEESYTNNRTRRVQRKPHRKPQRKPHRKQRRRKEEVEYGEHEDPEDPEDPEESDIDVILNREAKKDEKIIRARLSQNSDNKLTNEQIAALQLLDQHEKEQEDLDEYVMARRKQMQKDMKNPPKSEVKFTLSADAQQNETAETADADEETIAEETVDETVEETVNSTLPTEVKPVDSSSITQQIEDALAGKSEQLVQLVQSVQPANTSPTVSPVVFRHTEAEPAPINALTKLSANKRDALLQQIYVDAKAKIINKYPKEKNQDIINAKIKKECDSMLKQYMDTH